MPVLLSSFPPAAPAFHLRSFSFSQNREPHFLQCGSAGKNTVSVYVKTYFSFTSDGGTRPGFHLRLWALPSGSAVSMQNTRWPKRGPPRPPVQGHNRPLASTSSVCCLTTKPCGSVCLGSGDSKATQRIRELCASTDAVQFSLTPLMTMRPEPDHLTMSQVFSYLARMLSFFGLWFLAVSNRLLLWLPNSDDYIIWL